MYLATVFLIFLPLAVLSYLAAPGLATFGTVGPGVTGGVASLSLMVTGLWETGGGMVGLALALGDFPSGGWLLSSEVFAGPAPVTVMAAVPRQNAVAAWCRVR